MSVSHRQLTKALARQELHIAIGQLRYIRTYLENMQGKYSTKKRFRIVIGHVEAQRKRIEKALGGLR